MRADWIPETVPELIRLRGERSPRLVACRHRDARGRWLPTRWGELSAIVRRVAAALRRHGLGLGDRLAILAPTSREWLIAELAALQCGAVVVGIDPLASAEHAEFVLGHSASRGLIVGGSADLKKLPESTWRELRFVATLSHDAALEPRVLPWSAFLDARDAADDWAPVVADDIATLIYTSGTTGCPKAIAVTHGQLTIACLAIVDAYPQLGRGDATLCWLPMAHMFQRMMNLVALACGATTYFLEDPRTIMEAVREARPSVFVAVPRFYEKLHAGILEARDRLPPRRRRLLEAALAAGAEREESRRAGRPLSWTRRTRAAALDWFVLRRLRQVMGGRLRFAITGSAATPVWLLEFFASIGLPVLEAYGLSENTVPMAANRPDDYRFGSVGKPLWPNDVVVAPDGEILVRGPGVFGGYEQSTLGPELFAPDGYYRTGDVGRLDDDGYLYLTGRKADLIKTSTGRRIAPARIEQAYLRSLHFEQMIVVGAGRSHLAGLIVLDRRAVETELTAAGDDEEPAELPDVEFVGSPRVRQLVRRELTRLGRDLAPYERVERFALLSEPLTVERGLLTPLLKPRREAIAARYAPLIDRLYHEPSAAAAEVVTP